jgi:hypothetical protein
LNFSASHAPATAPCWSSRPQVRNVFHSLRSVANKFAADGVKAVVGHFNSGVSIPASDVYAESNISGR